MRKQLTLLFSFLAFNAYQQTNFGIGYGLHFIPVEIYEPAAGAYYNQYSSRVYFKNTFNPEQQLYFHIERLKPNLKDRFQFGVLMSYFQNEYHRELYSQSTSSPSDSQSTSRNESADLRDYRVGLTYNYLHTFNERNNVRFEMGIGFVGTISVARQFKSPHGTVIKTSYSSTGSNSFTSTYDSISNPTDLSIAYVSLRLPVGFRFGAKLGSSIHISPGINVSKHLTKTILVKYAYQFPAVRRKEKR